MSLKTIELTEFTVERLQCVGGEGRAAPYRITTYRGMELGILGEIMSEVAHSANSTFNQRRGMRFIPTRLANCLSAFGLQKRG